MCGIAGYLRNRPSGRSPRVLERMAIAIRHRGPDGQGYFEDEHCGLVHRRLSIVDVGGGAQPMFSEDRRFAIVFNGEIYNHAELARDLRARGHVYASHCDTETIVHLYEERGTRALAELRGMFAFAIWDAKKRELFCARDRLGIKPLYYYHDRELFVFGSEIKAILEHPAISASLETGVLAEYLAFGYVSEERTLFRGIRKLMPGHVLRISPGDFEPRIYCYWDLPLTPAIRQMRDSEWIRETRTRLEEAVASHLMSDVPLGMFLSGGLDSSAIAAILQRKSASPVKTFAVGYAEARFSELSFAKAVAQSIGTDHYETRVSRDQFFRALPEMIRHEDEPIAWPSSVSLYFVSKLAADHVKVVLTGEGSDELFGGYGRYRYQLINQQMSGWYRWMPDALRRSIRDSIAHGSWISAGFRRKLQHTVLGRTSDLESLYLANFYGAFSREEQQRLLGPLYERDANPYSTYQRFFDDAAALGSLEQMLHADRKTYLVELLMKQDQMSMAASIESRVPFLDHRFVEFSCEIPARLKLRGGVAKYVLKEAVRDLLPPEIIHRAKMGFPTPLKQWLRDPDMAYLYTFLEKPDGLIARHLDLSLVRDLFRRHREGVEDATDRIWSLLNLQHWGDLFLYGRDDRVQEPASLRVP